MKATQWIIGTALLLLVGAAIAGLVWTRDLGQPKESEEAGKAPANRRLARTAAETQRPLVDLRPLQTARRVAALAATPEEQRLAHEAAKVGDHEVDLAFFDALRTAEDNPPKLSPEAKQLVERKNKMQQAVAEDQASISVLTRKVAAASEAQKDNLQDQLDVAKAQLELDQDELDDAAEDLEQAGGDPQAKIKRLQAEHEASGHDVTQTGSAVNPHEQDYQAHTLLSVVRAWQALREKKQKIEEAQQETIAKQQRLNKRHETLTAQVEQEKENREAVKQQAKGFAKSSKAASRDESMATAKSALDALKQYTRDQKNLADLGRRVQDEQELNEIYGNWIGLIKTRQRAALHHIIEGILWILVVLLAVYI